MSMRIETIAMEELVPLLQLQLEQGGRAPLTVTGSSMLPMLHHRQDQVFLKPVTQPPEARAVALYRRDTGVYVLHRLIRPLKAGGYLCCGDNQWQTETIRADQLIALVDSFSRKGRLWSVQHPVYRLYSFLWCAFLPVRRPVLAVRRCFGKLRKRLCGPSKP